jgi:putative heme iron utilization protein
VSALAEHTKNMRDDPRVSLLVHEPSRDVQAAGRLTVVGRAEPLDPVPALRDRYLRYQPDAAGLLGLGDFAFCVIVPEVLRYIAGFGRIEWIPAASFAPPDSALVQQESEIVAHMNADHTEALRSYCRTLHAREAATVEMVGIDCDGLDVRADDELLRIDFEQPVADAAGARTALAALARQCRAG